MRESMDSRRRARVRAWPPSNGLDVSLRRREITIRFCSTDVLSRTLVSTRCACMGANEQASGQECLSLCVGEGEVSELVCRYVCVFVCARAWECVLPSVRASVHECVFESSRASV